MKILSILWTLLFSLYTPQSVKSSSNDNQRELRFRQDGQVASICHRTVQVQREILKKIDKTDCSNVSFKDFKEIKKLNLNNYSITRLKKGDFDNLTSLQVLWLISNQLRELPAWFFKKQPNLNIELGNNPLSFWTKVKLWWTN